MKKLIFIFSLILCLNLQAQTYFRSTTVDTASVTVSKGFVQLKTVNFVNLSTTILYVKLYDKATAAKTTDHPKLTYKLGSNALTNSGYDGIRDAVFTKGLQIRCTTGATDTSSAPPTTKPIIEVGY